MKVLVIINEQIKAGRDKRLEGRLAEKFAGSLVGVVRTDYRGHGKVIAREAAQRGVDCVVAFGGDGTVNEVLNGISGTKTKLGIIPGGTANDLATHYSIPKDFAAACDIINRGFTHCADVICVNGWNFITAGGLGLGSEAIAITEAFRRGSVPERFFAAVLGSKLYILGVLCAFFKYSCSRNQIRIRSAEQSGPVDAFSLIAGNQPVIGNNFRVTPEAVNDDGCFDVCVIKYCNNRLRLFRAVLKNLWGTHVGLANVVTFRASAITLDVTRPVSFFGDGERGLTGTRFDIAIRPRAVKILVPFRKG